MFEKNCFIQDCIAASSEGKKAMCEVVKEALCNSAEVMATLGEPKHAGIVPLYQSQDLTIINFTWAPYMNLLPHNHQMYAVIGVYSGREDNIFWRRKDANIEAAGAQSLGVGDVATLGHDVIHSVLNPIEKMTCAIHVYGGNFFQPETPRSEWDHETLMERPWDIEQAKSLFKEAESRFNRV